MNVMSYCVSGVARGKLLPAAITKRCQDNLARLAEVREGALIVREAVIPDKLLKDEQMRSFCQKNDELAFNSTKFTNGTKTRQHNTGPGC